MAFFPLSRAWRRRLSVASADLISRHRCTLPWLHHTLLEALSPWPWRGQQDTLGSLCGLETYPYSHTGLCKRVAERSLFASECQARVRGSTREPLATSTVWPGRRRMTCVLFLSSLPFSPIAYQRVCWGGGLIHYQRLAADCLQPPLRSGFRQQLKAGVGRPNQDQRRSHDSIREVATRRSLR